MIITMVRSSPACSLMTRNLLLILHSFFTGHMTSTKTNLENTTIGAIITNAAFTKSQLCKIAGMTHNGYARSIRPVHTSADGDSIYALSVGNIPADCDMVGTLAADVIAEAILSAIRNTESAYGFPAYKDLSFV